jgi:PKD repeat protein
VETVFTDVSSELATGAIYSWDFNGDGLEDSANPGSTSFVYEAPGTYAASLTIYNADLCSATKTIQVEVLEIPGCDLGDDVQLCIEATVMLDAGAGYASYFWKGGSTNQTLTVDTYGEYWVSITDVKGCANIDTVEVRLKNLPVAQFEYKVTYSPFDGIVVNIENTSADADTWAWDFGDGGTGDEMSPSHAYSDFSFYKETPYTICLTASDVCGISDQFCVDILLSPTALLENDNDIITVYPNPGTGVFNVYFPDYLSTPNQLTVLDAGGKIVEKMGPIPSSGFQVNLENRATGVYYFMIDFEQTQVIKRVILK